MTTLTLIQVQQRYIDRLLHCHPGHARRVRRAAGRALCRWAAAHGYDPAVVLRDADDMLTLIARADD